ncbi:hypothetical protein M1446_05710 [Candidatus Dependentiae bacterium]|nr:hypothetical protein [Candidatus Dependentiae bacterium]
MVKLCKILLCCVLFITADISSWPKSTARSSGSRSGSRSSSSRSGSYHSSTYRSNRPNSTLYEIVFYIFGGFLYVIMVFIASLIYGIISKIKIYNYKKKFHSNLLEYIPLKGDENVLLGGPVTKNMLNLLLKRLPTGNITVVEEINKQVSIENNNFDVVVLLIALDIEEEKQKQRERIFHKCINACVSYGYIVVIEREIELDSRWNDPVIPPHIKFNRAIVFTELNEKYKSLENVKNDEDISSYPWRAVILNKIPFMQKKLDKKTLKISSNIRKNIFKNINQNI